MYLRRTLICLALIGLPHASNAQVRSITGSYKNAGAGWDRGMATTMHCGNSPESWVRGNASLDPSAGVLIMTVQLETDATNAGPKGKVMALLKDVNGKTLATATTDEIGTGGKPPGHAAIRNFTSQITIDTTVARRIDSIYLDAQCTGSVDRIFNINLGTVQDAFKIILAIAAAAK